MSRHNLLGLIIQLGLVALIGFTAICRADEPVATLRLPDDSTEKVIDSLPQRVATLKGRFVIQEGNAPPRQVTVSWDRSGDRLNAYLSRPRQENEELYVHSFVKNHDVAWDAKPEYAPEVKGIWVVQLTSAAKTALPRDNCYGEFGLNFINEEILTPPAVTSSQREFPLMVGEGFRLTVTDTPGQKPGTITRTYAIFSKELLLGDITYSLEKTEQGIRLVAVADHRYINGKPMLGMTRQYSDFKLTGGVWIPMTTVNKKYDRKSGEQTNVSTLKFESLEVNVVFPDDTFVYQPPYGSRVHDQSTGMTYRAGYNNPSAPLGHDTSPVAMVDSTPPKGPTTLAAGSQLAPAPGEPEQPGSSASSGTGVGLKVVIMVVFLAMCTLGLFIVLSRKKRV